jgi:hypothetical protein
LGLLERSPATAAAALFVRRRRGEASLNQVILEEPTEATIGGRQKADFSDVAGRWTPDVAFDKTMAAQRQTDWGKWKPL